MPKRNAKRKSKKARQSARRNNQQDRLLPFGLLLLALVLLLGIGSAVVYTAMNRSAATPATQDATEQATTEQTTADQVIAEQATTEQTTTAQTDLSPTLNAQPLAIGGVTGCQHNPDFSDTLGFAQVAIDTSGQRGKGLVLFDFAASNRRAAENSYQHATWDDAGDIGSYTLDKHGNLYIAPFPQVDLFENPLGQQNTVYRIDTTTGIMAPFVELPAAQPASTSNPFGVVAMTYDCEVHSLYATSLAGSTRKEELGRILHIDPEDGHVLSSLDSVDAYGITIFNGGLGKRLYFGHARSGEMRSIALDEAGRLLGEPRREFTLADAYTAHALIARRITIREQVMKVDGLKFQYNLVPMVDQGPRPSFRYLYDVENDEWQFAEMVRDDF